MPSAQDSPLIGGTYGRESCILASDVPAVLKVYQRRILY